MLLNQPVLFEKEDLPQKQIHSNEDHHVIWEKKEMLYPHIDDYLLKSTPFNAKLFIEISEPSMTLTYIIALFQCLIQQARHQKKKVFGLYCCYTIWAGYTPIQSAHEEWSRLKKLIDFRRTEHQAEQTNKNLLSALMSLAGIGRYCLIEENHIWLAVPTLLKCFNSSDKIPSAFISFFSYCPSTIKDLCYIEDFVDVEAWRIAKK